MNGTLSKTAKKDEDMLKGLGDLGDMAKMMKAMKDMQPKMAKFQEDMARMQEDLGRIVVVGEAGAGLVKARCTAKGVLTGLEIDPTILVPSEKEVIEDLIVAAIKDAQTKAADRAEQEMAKLTGDLGLPPGMNLPF